MHINYIDSKPWNNKESARMARRTVLWVSAQRTRERQACPARALAATVVVPLVSTDELIINTDMISLRWHMTPRVMYYYYVN